MARHQELKPGFVIADKYEVIKCLGTGSMGAVYACKHKELSGHIIAAKVLFPEVANDKISAARFRNEIFASYGVSHPNVVRAYEYIKEKDIVAYTMEYVNGGDLADCLKSPKDLLSINRIIEILVQMTAGVRAIHEAGIIHRDLKPENILLTKSGNVKIADFGIARTERGPRLTEHGGIIGTIDYVSPEYMLNSQIDYRSDIYAIGILAYEMITGMTPFRGETVYDAMVARLKEEIEPPSNKRKECPTGLDDIVLKALEREPEERYQTVKELHYDLEKLQKILNGDESVIQKEKEQEKLIDTENEQKEIDKIREIIRNVQGTKSKKGEVSFQTMESVLSRNADSYEVRDIEIKEPCLKNMNRLAKEMKAKSDIRNRKRMIRNALLILFLIAILIGIVALIEYFYPEYKLLDKIIFAYNKCKIYIVDKFNIIFKLIQK